jgi:hypothetical protein
MKRYFLHFTILALLNQRVLGQSQVDTTNKATFSILPRFNSMGHFPFTGALINHNLNFDLNIFYQKKTAGFFIFKSFDLKDSHSIINYLQPGIFKQFTVSNSLSFNLYFGYIFAQTASFKDDDSDYYTALSTNWKISKKLRLENTLLFSDLTIQKKMTNRLLLKYSLKAISFDFYLWQRSVFETGQQSTSIALALNFPKFRISEKIALQSTLSYLSYVSKIKPDFALQQGVLFSVGFPLD